MNDTDKALVAIPWDELGIPKPANQPIPKSVVREAYRVLAMPFIKPIAEAQIARAMGISHFMLRDPESGEWRRLTDPDQITAALNHPDASAGSTYYIHTKDPDMAAISDLLNRCLDKPKEQPQEVVVHDGDRIRERLEAWKLANRKSE